MCLSSVGSPILNGSASALTVASPLHKRATIARRVGSASAANARFRRRSRFAIRQTNSRDGSVSILVFQKENFIAQRPIRILGEGVRARSPTLPGEDRGSPLLAMFCCDQPSLCGRNVPGFPAQHRALAGEAPVIAGDGAALAEHAMTRHHERQRILADRGADRARGCRAARSSPRCRNRWWPSPSEFSAASPRPGPRSRCRSAPRATAGPCRHSFESKMRCASGAVRALSST